LAAALGCDDFLAGIWAAAILGGDDLLAAIWAAAILGGGYLLAAIWAAAILGSGYSWRQFGRRLFLVVALDSDDLVAVII